MKRVNLWTGLLALGLAAGCLQLTPGLLAQSPAQPPGAQQQPDQQKTRTFTGQVVKTKDGRYALLTDKQAGKGFYLDNQDKAKGFEGQNVKVTGTLDLTAGVIHIAEIVPA